MLANFVKSLPMKLTLLGTLFDPVPTTSGAVIWETEQKNQDGHMERRHDDWNGRYHDNKVVEASSKRECLSSLM